MLMTYKQALEYLKQRLGDDKVASELIVTDAGYCNGIIYKVGRSKHVVCGEVNFAQLRLFADGIEYSAKKRAEKKARAIACAA
jgi:hypothetical protein